MAAVVALAVAIWALFWFALYGAGAIFRVFGSMRVARDARDRRRDWLARTAHLTDAERGALEREADEFFKGC